MMQAPRAHFRKAGCEEHNFEKRADGREKLVNKGALEHKDVVNGAINLDGYHKIRVRDGL
jgi:hypothetical protein